jgi:hypothetical protein
MVSAAYSMKTILEMEQEVNNIEQRFFARLDELYVGKEECDLGSWVEYFAFDVSSQPLQKPSHIYALHELKLMQFGRLLAS